MGAGMKRAREEEPVSLALSLATDSTSSCTTSADSSGEAPAAAQKKRARRGRVVATSGEGDSVCKTCGRAFASFQALGGHRTSHLRGRHGLELQLGVGVAKAIRERKRSKDKQSHECQNCGLGFETGQALSGHMRRHREEMALSGGAGIGIDDQWVLRSVCLLTDQQAVGRAADRPPVLLDLFV